MKVFLCLVMIISLLVFIITVFKKNLKDYIAFLELRNKVLTILNDLGNSEESFSRFSYLIYIIKPELLKLMDNNYYDNSTNEKLYDIYSRIENIQKELENAEPLEEDKIPSKEKHLNELLEIETEVEKMNAIKLMIFDFIFLAFSVIILIIIGMLTYICVTI